MNIDKTINYLRKISSANKISYQVSKSQARDNEMLKLADIVAAAGRKMRKSRYDLFDLEVVETGSLKYYLNKIR